MTSHCHVPPSHKLFPKGRSALRCAAHQLELERLTVTLPPPTSPKTTSSVHCETLLLSGFFANAARLHHSGAYRTVRDDHELLLHPTSVLHASTPPPAWVLFNEVSVRWGRRLGRTKGKPQGTTWPHNPNEEAQVFGHFR